MFEHHGHKLDLAGDMHIQQSALTTGTLRVADTGYSLVGIGFKDHSSGPRDVSTWYGHRFFNIITADWACHVMVVFGSDGEPQPPLGSFFRGSQRHLVTRFELPPLADSAGGPLRGEVVIELDNGEVFEFESELMHCLPMTFSQDNDNINGIDWDLDPEPIVLIEGKGRLLAPDGTVAYCYHERSAPRSAVRMPAASHVPCSGHSQETG
jgi:hypothetical protein